MVRPRRRWTEEQIGLCRSAMHAEREVRLINYLRLWRGNLHPAFRSSAVHRRGKKVPQSGHWQSR